MMKLPIQLGLVALLALTTAACGGAEYDDTGAAPQPEAAPVVEEPQAEEAADDAVAEPAEAEAEAPEEVAVEEAAPPVQVKTAMEATDPSTVQLASGTPQLVEFFAFW